MSSHPRFFDFARRAGALAALFFLLGTAGAVHAERKQINIDAGLAQKTLLTFIEQTGLQLAFEMKAVQGKTTHAVNGQYEAKDALTIMLDGTGLVFDFVNAKTIAVAPSGSPRRPATELHSEANSPQAQDSHANIQVAGLKASSDASSESSEQTVSDNAAVRVDELKEVVITGTHIRGAAPESSPVTIYTRKDIEQTGVGTVEQFARLIPENFGSTDAITYGHANDDGKFSQFGTNIYGGSSFNLRGLGAGSTLILVNGKRMAPAGIRGESIDVSLVPLSSVEQIEVLPDGASAIYGSDAVAGVVNLKLRKDFRGAETTVRYGDSTDGGAAQFIGSQLLGTSWAGGNATLIYEYVHNDSLLSTDRDFIPNQNGPATMIPGNKRNSVIASGSQELLGNTLSADVSYSDRKSFNDVFDFFGTASHGEYKSRQYNANLGIEHNFNGGWHGELSGSYGKLDESGVTVDLVSRLPFTVVPTSTKLRSAELSADGSLFDIPGGSVKIAMGAGYRNEQIQNLGILPAWEHLSRNISSEYAEFLVPFIKSRNAKPWARKLELTVAGRHDHYSDVGSATIPRVGLSWSPIDSLNVRSTFDTSFRAPLLYQTVYVPSYIVADIPDPSASDGITTTLIDGSFGKSGLKPEKSRSFSFGFDVKPTSIPQLSVSLTYFHTFFSNRISTPPLTGGYFDLYSQTATLSPFISRSPSPADVEKGLTSPGTTDVRFITNPNPPPLSSSIIEATFDGRETNIAWTKQSSLSLSTALNLHSRYGIFDCSFSGNYILENRYRTLSTLPIDSLLNITGEPMDFRMRALVGWSRGGLGSSIAVNYSDGYRNIFLTPSGSIRSWTTTDLQLSYRFGNRAPLPVVSDLSFVLSVQNIFNQAPPPLVVTPLQFLNSGYDAANASPLGRFVAFQLGKRW